MAARFGNLEIELGLDGLVVYKTAAGMNKIRDLRFVNNSFALLAGMQKGDDSEQDIVIKKFVRQMNSESLHQGLEKVKTFRVVFSKENRATSLSRELRQEMENRIMKVTGMDIEPLKPEVEFWIMYRREGYWFFGLRLTNQVDQSPVQKGELRSQLAHLLCLISEPSSEDVVLDPFCGYGSIPIEIAWAFAYRQIIVSDKDSKLIKDLESNTKALRKFDCHVWDALQLNEVAENSIDKIITDPPWGIYESKGGDEMVKFYQQMLNEFQRIVKSGGLIVVLTGAKSEFESALNDSSKQLTLLKSYDVLVSGKKAGVYKIKK